MIRDPRLVAFGWLLVGTLVASIVWIYADSWRKWRSFVKAPTFGARLADGLAIYSVPLILSIPLLAALFVSRWLGLGLAATGLVGVWKLESIYRRLGWRGPATHVALLPGWRLFLAAQMLGQLWMVLAVTGNGVAAR